MTELERRYRWLLRAYPPGYRADYEDELLDVLLATAGPGQARPPLREVRALLVGGIKARVIAAAQGPAWMDGLHLAVTVLSLLQLGVLIPYAGTIPLWVALSALALVAVLRGRMWAALPLVAANGLKIVGVTYGEPWLDGTLLPVFPDRLWQGPALYGTGGPIAPSISYLVLFFCLAVLAIRGRPSRRRSWWWLLALPLVAGADPAWLDIAEGTSSSITRVGLEAALLAGAAYAGHLTGDARWAVAAGVCLVPATAVLAENVELASRQGVAHAALLILLTATAAAVPFRARRRILL